MTMPILSDTLLSQFGLMSLSSTTQSFVLTFISLPFIIRLAKSRRFLDTPNERKIHASPTPTLGGIGIFIGLALTALIWLIPDLRWEKEWLVLLSGMLLLFMLGLQDDLKEIRASHKLLVQFAVALLTAWAGFRFVSLHGFLGVEQMPLWLQYGLSAFIITGIINAYNLLDGLDGLAGGIALINCMVFGLLFTLGEQPLYATLSFAMAGSLGAFLYFNFNPARIFMGDSGSLVIGYLMAALAFKAVSPMNAMASPLNQQNVMIIVFAILLLPVADTLRVFTFRILQGDSPFKADNNHIHHLLLKIGLSVRQTALLIYVINITFISLAVLLRTITIEWAIGIQLIVASVVFLMALIMSRVRVKNIKVSPSKEVPFNRESPYKKIAK
jgi:UDP-GlcNAc:undecaprenyl-phosphate/decaprenyl-phosphate GlcNAc-1-phosphate transferase